MPYGYGSAVMLGGGSEGDLLQKTLHIACVLAQSTLWRWLGNFKMRASTVVVLFSTIGGALYVPEPVARSCW